MPAALAQVVADVDCDLLILSYNDESWLTLDQLVAMCAHNETVATLSFDSPRYVGARIGIHNPFGERVGTVSHLRNHEYLVLAGSRGAVELATGAAARWVA
jgi:adenine-specific DNA-methyltransferase